MSRPPWLILVSPDSADRQTLEQLEQLLPGLEGCIDLLILRWNATADREVLDSARRLGSCSPRPPILLRDRFDLARAAGLDGVQLPERGLDPAAVRAWWPGARIGVSRHDRAGLLGRSGGADFALLSPVYRSVSKPGAPSLGLDGFKRQIQSVPVPVVALGGVDVQNSPDLIRAGAAGVAVRSAVFGDVDPLARARALREALDSAVAPPPDH